MVSFRARIVRADLIVLRTLRSPMSDRSGSSAGGLPAAATARWPPVGLAFRRGQYLDAVRFRWIQSAISSARAGADPCRRRDRAWPPPAPCRSPRRGSPARRASPAPRSRQEGPAASCPGSEAAGAFVAGCRPVDHVSAPPEPAPDAGEFRFDCLCCPARQRILGHAAGGRLEVRDIIAERIVVQPHRNGTLALASVGTGSPALSLRRIYSSTESITARGLPWWVITTGSRARRDLYLTRTLLQVQRGEQRQDHCSSQRINRIIRRPSRASEP